MKVATAAGIRPRNRRTPAVIVADPRITIVESTETADRPALDDALGLLVKWAVRSFNREQSTSVPTLSDEKVATCGAED